MLNPSPTLEGGRARYSPYHQMSSAFVHVTVHVIKTPASG